MPAKNKEKMLAFYNFPADHWQHIRTTPPSSPAFHSAAENCEDKRLRDS
ncbi:MAG: hypothetical protein OXC07_04695 [Kistimonas sp.]|nr:hypothetical protein [Kistimonas sp.]